jgi:hypothetical protein
MAKVKKMRFGGEVDDAYNSANIANDRNIVQPLTEIAAARRWAAQQPTTVERSSPLPVKEIPYYERPGYQPPRTSSPPPEPEPEKPYYEQPGYQPPMIRPMPSEPVMPPEQVIKVPPPVMPRSVAKKGGLIKNNQVKKRESASRGDGIAQRGRTKGTMVKMAGNC